VSFNLDFTQYFTGLPTSYGAASGQTGTWVDVPLGVTGGLTSTAGIATAVNITTTGRGDAFNPQTTTDGILLRDSFVNDDFDLPPVAFSATLTGLANGEYTVYYYHFAATSGLEINGAPMNDLAGGSADALGAQGSNWDAVQVTVTGGSLEIVDTTPDFDTAGLSGIQILMGPSLVDVPQVGGAIARTFLHAARPNPFGTATELRFSLLREGPVEIDVFNVTGQRVARLVNGTLTAGEHFVSWSGHDDGGRMVGRGVYYVRMRANGLIESRTIVRLR
jgi:hypothetical protein